MQQPKTKVALRGASETLIMTLLARAMDAAASRPILHDDWARRVLEQLDYTFPPTAGDQAFNTGLLLRANLLDAWATEFLDEHPEATVLHLGCGLDSRALRLACDARVRWIDVDLPDVVELRQKVYPAPAGDYCLVAASVTDDAWLDDIPADRPTLVVMEGLLPYLEPAQAQQLIGRICTRFPRGQIIFDMVGWFFIHIQAWSSPIGRTGATLRFSMDNKRDLLAVSPKLAVRDFVTIHDIPGHELFPWYMRLFTWLCRRIPLIRTVASYFRCDF